MLAIKKKRVYNIDHRWGLMTLTTVGYGDLSPSTFPGKLIGNYFFLEAKAPTDHVTQGRT
jgi:hypothetical protein